MPLNEEQNNLPSKARRHFLGVAGAAGAKAAVIGAAAATILPSLAHAVGTPWWKDGGGKGGNPMCFLRGTSIATPEGEVSIEDLQIGDFVQTVRGEGVEVKWIGRHTYQRSGLTWNNNVVPIRVARHALDQHTPHRDLYLSPGHALLIDGVLIRVKDLINGLSIMPSPPADSDTIEYFHIVLDTHEVILAEGAPAETFLLRDSNHEGFKNFAEFLRLYPAAAQKTMTPFAPTVGLDGGRRHLKALLKMGGSWIFKAHEPNEEDAYERIAARAQAMAR